MSKTPQKDESRRSLLVPMNIEALVVGATPIADEWMSLKPEFRYVHRDELILGQQLEIRPCENTVSDLYDDPGVYLHWALPDGLTHGVTGDDREEPEFPLIPNRWLILRLWDQSKDEQLDLKTKGWIIESDTITDDEDAPVWPTMGSENLKNKEDYYVHIGKQFDLGKWPGEGSAPSVEITALGYGDPAFAAHYPACRGILGFHDKHLHDLQDVELMYLVFGWYSDPSKDPLHQAMMEKTVDNLNEFLGERKWTYPGFDDAQKKSNEAADVKTDLEEAKKMLERIQSLRPDSKQETDEIRKHICNLEEKHRTLVQEVDDIRNDLPVEILCHGVISKIKWERQDTLYDSGVPRGKPFRVAVGNTAIEALTTLFKKTLGNESDLSRLLEAFQYDLLSELEKSDGHERVEQKIHERTFKPLSRGIRWDLVQEEGATVGDSTQERTPAIPGEIRTLLEMLNSDQREVNRLKRELDSVKSELYATWYKSVLKLQDDVVNEEILKQTSERREAQIKAIEDLTAKIAYAENRARSSRLDQLRKKVDTFLPGYNVEHLDEPRFWQPNDPVVVLAGPAFKRSSRHGEDGRYRLDGRLLCRLSGQEISGIKMTVPHAKKADVVFGPEDLNKWCQPLNESGIHPLPKVVSGLFREYLLMTLDSKRAQAIATAAYEKNEAGLAKKYPDEVKEFALDLLNKYLEKVWEDACDRKTESSHLRYEDEDKKTVWELVGEFPSPVMLKRWERNPWLPLFLQWQITWEPSYTDSSQALENWSLDDRGTAFECEGKDPEGRVPNEYSGTTFLTSSAALQLSERLRRYNLDHDNSDLKRFQTEVSSMNVLCQSLGGLTDQFLMRKALLELRPLDPVKEGEGFQLSSIFDTVKDIDWLSPLTDGHFLPVRAGRLKIERLWIIDTFGQILRLEGEDPDEVAQPLVPGGLMGGDGYVRLGPRLAQPARLKIQWPRADRWDTSSEEDRSLQKDEAFNPICGWILPNFLDRGLMIYDAGGKALGALQAVQKKSWAEGVGALREEIESFHWVDIPGSETFFFGKPPEELDDPLGENANPHLHAFVRGLLSLTEGSGPAFGQLIENMNEALSVAGGPGSSQDPNLALLIGKPLALIRARICLELDGRSAYAQGWKDLGKDETGGVENVKFAIRLGDRRKWNDLRQGDDGLVGFFSDRDWAKSDPYTRFYPAYGLNGGGDDEYNKYNFMPTLTVEQPLDLTLLMDPSRGICVTSGILPRKIFNLPYGDPTETLENKQVIFFTGPLVITSSEIRMPQPSDVYGQWSWTHHPEVKVWREDSIADCQKEQGWFFESPLQITEGWLKLITAPLAIKVFKIKGREPEPAKTGEKPAETEAEPIPAQFEASPNETIILQWVAIGAEQIELREGDSTLFTSNLHPLPTQYRIKVGHPTSFTLIATDRTDESSEENEKHKRIERTIEIVFRKEK